MRFEVVAFEPAIRVMWRFVSTYDDPDNPASEWTGQTFDWRIEPRTERVLLGNTMDVAVVRLTNAGWPEPSRWQGFCTTGWGATLDDKLKPLCETGSTSSGKVGG